MTIDQFFNCVEGYEKRIENEIKLVDNLNHSLGRYITIGAHSPKSYPTRPYTHEEKKTNLMSFDKFEELARKKYGKK